MSRRFPNIASPFEAPPKDDQKFYSTLSVLVLEDTAFAASLIQSILKNLGIGKILAARDMTDALTLLAQHQVHVAIVNDQETPNGGLSLVRMIRSAEDKLPQSLPIILVTAKPELSAIMAARDAGVTEVLSKPFSASQLRLRIDSVIKNPRPIVQGGDFLGPDRRRRVDANSNGKRSTDASS